MWFDEYDNAGTGKGYLGYPTSASYIIADYGNDGMVFRRNFENGIVICNPSEMETTITLEDEYLLINGVQVPHVNTGEWTSTVSITSKDGRILLNRDVISVQ
jgi:hypothetical protein